MLTLACFPQAVVGAAAHNIDAVLDEALNQFDDAEFARLPIDNGQHDDAEVDLHLRVLIQVVEHHFGLFAAFQFKNDAHAVAIALVAHVANIVDDFLVHQLGNPLDELGLVAHKSGDVFKQAGLVDLEWNFRNDDGFAVALAVFFDGCLGAHLEAAAASGVVINDAPAAQQESSSGEIGPRNHFDNLGQRRMRVVDQRDSGVNNLAQIMRRDVGGHADGDAR